MKLRRDGLPLITLPAHETKPGIRDLVHEVPDEIARILMCYIERVRPVLLQKNPDHGFLFVAQGGQPLEGSAVYAVFRTRTEEILGKTKNPHQVRKAWASGHSRWSKGDFLVASAILDSSPMTIQKTYQGNLCAESLVRHDALTETRWDEAMETASSQEASQ